MFLIDAFTVLNTIIKIKLQSWPEQHQPVSAYLS